MERQEFFLLMPAIIYGVALIDLLKVFGNNKIYWELLAWGSLLMVNIIVIWLELWAKLDLVATDKWFFILVIIQAILLAQIAGVITPEEKHIDTKIYFHSIRRTFFLLISATIIFNFLSQELFYDDQRSWLIRPFILIMALACAFINKLWIRIASLVIIYGLLIKILLSI
jgi:hypothetical protein